MSYLCEKPHVEHYSFQNESNGTQVLIPRNFHECWCIFPPSTSRLHLGEIRHNSRVRYYYLFVCVLKTITSQYCYILRVCYCRDALCQAFRILRKESQSHAWLWQRYLRAKNIGVKNGDRASYHSTSVTPQHSSILSTGYAVHTHTHGCPFLFQT